ncbi:MAG: CARDB domain-containing protein [Candidatus Pseudobacter hemicellulosilyticus]|uniref:CARDB domain-containing protein n=1 Tax=Candidatus Pseudobacter hemicellulosilyticus TaxID=3121375 RepID=A0AAJ5WQ08_9BACT|nr:MAG: CARDB domain-containing protein [Pseudobacter sp.]
MKKLLHTIVLTVCVVMAYAQSDPAYPPAPAAAGNITAVEYFIDNDPGVGGGTALPLSAAVNLANLNAAINVNGLGNGMHRLYIRSRSAAGHWSLVASRDFLYDADIAYPGSPAAAQAVTGAEYFIDTDPGVGGGTAIPLTPGVTINNLAVIVNTAGLIPGIHRVYVRTRSQEGHWSLVHSRDFAVDFDPAYPAAPASAQHIVAAEYFYDDDPGVGNGTSISLTPGLDINNLDVAANTASLSLGTHRIYLRTRSQEGHWSLTMLREFTVEQSSGYPYPTAPAAAGNIVSGEYFLDTDPGFGRGTAFTLIPGTVIDALDFAASVNGLANGTHRIYFRTRSQEGHWGLTQMREFIVDDEVGYPYPAAPAAAGNITGAEYFLDTDPGVGRGTLIPVTAATDIHDLDVAVSTSGLADGMHRLYLRTRSQEGRWSISSVDSFRVGEVVLVTNWTIEPAGGHQYGTLATGNSASHNFTIRNTGNVPIVLTEVVSSDPAFVPVYTAGANIPGGGTLQLPVSFTPAAVNSYSGTIQIRSSTTGTDSVTVAVSGSGYTPGTPPAVGYVSAAPYNGTQGISATVGQPGIYTYKMVYTSANNRPPQAGYPKIGIDRTGDQDFDDPNEGIYTMTKEGNSTDYAAGVVYTYSVNHADYSNTLGYRFFATDDQGNSANAAYASGPVISFQLLDLRIFANDISFSNNKPNPGDAVTVFANISNNSAYTATNVPISYYRDTVLIGTGVIPVVNPYSVASISKLFNFPEGFYPIKVWIDSSQTLNESNILNNYAIRPLVVGNVTLPGGINVTASTTLLRCPQKVLISGHAVYYGMENPPAVAGAEVTINLGTQVVTTTTNANGDFAYLIENPSCGGSLNYTVSITDFTFTSETFTGAQAVPCPAPNECLPPPPQPGVAMLASFSNDPCGRAVGSTGNITVTVTYRSRDLSNFWNAWDQILNDVVTIYHNGRLIETFTSADGTTSPGDVKTFPVSVSLDESGPNVIEARSNYTYVEYFQIPSSIYHGQRMAMSGYGSTTILAEDNRPDLGITDFQLTGFTSFSYAAANLKCGPAGTHLVRVFDSIPNGNRVQIQERRISSLGGKDKQFISFSDAGLTKGVMHFIRIVTDVEGEVSETDEGNNVFETAFLVPKPDLTIPKISVAPTAASPGSTVVFTATVDNSGTATGNFVVRFMAGGVQIGADKVVNGLAARGSTTVSSDPYTVTTEDFDCAVFVQAIADATNTVDESGESNNTHTITFEAQLSASQVPGRPGSAANPVVVRINTNSTFHPQVLNMGTRDVRNVTVRFTLNGTHIGKDNVGYVRAGIDFAAPASLTHNFETPGNYIVKLILDTANTICESNELDNEGEFHIRVVDANPDLEVLSQYISPSSLNPNPGQNITLVGTVKNVGLKVSTANVMRFLVDGIQVGQDIPFNALLPGQDTTVEASDTYGSLIAGTKVMKIVVDPDNTMLEEREDNNEATRALIVGDAPDMARSRAGAIRFNPGGFSSGDQVSVIFNVKNNGPQEGSAWVRFLVYDISGMLIGKDSTYFTLAAGQTMDVSKQMRINADRGTVITEIYGCTPQEFDQLNNTDTLAFSTVQQLKASVTVDGNLDMEAALPEQFPGWIGGQLVLGDYDLVVKGSITKFDSAHFVVTNGTGRLRFENSNAVNIFPVGAALNSPNFVSINNSGTPDHFSVGVAPYVLSAGTGGDTVKTGFVNRTWFIDEAVPGGSNVTLQFFWDSTHEQQGFQRSASRMAHYTSSWLLSTLQAAIQETDGRFSLQQAGYTSFSPFGVTSNTAPLPLRFLSFTAKPVNNDVQLEWITADEVNTAHFEVERSTDGISFQSITQLPSNNSAGQHRYTSLDRSPAGSILYYRIRQVDLDGRYEYSTIVRVNRKTGADWAIYPNPVSSFLRVDRISATEVRELRISTADGRTLLVTRPNAAMRYETGSLRNGMYILTIIRKDNQVESKPFIKH